MSSWSYYISRHDALGGSKRERSLNRLQDTISRKGIDSLSNQKVLINDTPQLLTVLNNKDDMHSKTICAMPNCILPHGGIVDFNDCKWLIVDVDSNNEVYTKGRMRRCNHLLKWINSDGDTIERWCVVEDGTKYLIGEKEKEMMTVGDSRMGLTIAKDSETAKLCRGMRFLIDDVDSAVPQAYQITKPNKLYSLYNGEGVYRFILREDNVTDNDNIELRIADYYKKKSNISTNKEGWL